MARLTRMPLWALLIALLVVSLPAARVARAAGLEIVHLSMGYIPNAQFTPFYVADARGYYAKVGLKVIFDYASAPDIIRLIGTGSVDFGNADADQVVVGRAHGLPVLSVFTQYQRFPVVVFALASSGIKSFADLKGKSIGIPGAYGTTYTGLLAALAAAHLTTSDVHLVTIGYAQVAEVAQHRVDAAVGYAMNEPVQLSREGFKVTVLPIAAIVPLAGPGIVTGQSLVAQHPDLVRRFVQATAMGQRDTNADPAGTFALARRYMPGISAKNLTLQLAVLRAAVPYWTPAHGHGLGCAGTASWTATQNTLLAQHQISSAMNPAGFFTNRFLSGC